MKMIKRVTTLFGVAALSASMLLTSGAGAQEISTTLTVENSTPACVDERPTSLNVGYSGTPGGSFGTLTGTTGNFAAKEVGGSIYMNLYVNTCLGQGWNVTAAISDFQSGSSTVDAAGHISIFAQSRTVFMGIVTDYSRPVRAKPAPFNSFSNPDYVPGTTGLPTPAGTTWGYMAVDGGENRSIFPNTVSTGSVESTGEMLQAIKFRTSNIPVTTAPGTYVAELTLTFTSTGP